ncbi:MAG: radical SAM protein [Anaerostipes sp.]|jgi:uncharacterized protein|nr:radical SAM protein [Anaerostipes sp.]
MNNQRYGMLFQTSENIFYYYDSGNGKVIKCNKEEKTIIENILNNSLTLNEACSTNVDFRMFIKKEDLFKCPEKRKFIVPTKEEFVKAVKSSCEQIILELTEICNLRCGYCIYNEYHPDFRGFSNKEMKFDIAKKSIDYVLEDYKRDEFALTFYGGEPLMNFSLMQKCIDYTKKKYKNIKLQIAFTTNLTLLTESMVRYFQSLDDDVDIMCSLDGPSDLHDKYRRYANGRGTFDDAVKGLKLLVDKFYDVKKKKTVSINCVLTPPYSKKNMDTINDFFYKILNIPEEIICNYSYVDGGNMTFDFEENEIIADDITGKLKTSPLEEWAVDNMINGKDKLKFFNIVGTDMARVAGRMKEEKGIIERTYLQGNCIPGQRRIYVTVDGDFRPCEKVGNSVLLGNYKDGYDFDKSYKLYIEDYIKNFEKSCDKCWARPMCSICYDQTMDGNGVKKISQEEICDSSRRIIKDLFINYYRLFEQDREGLEYLLKKTEFS